MRIGVSAWRLSGQWTGVARYIQYLVKNWEPILDPGDRVTLYVPEQLPAGALPLSDAIRTEIVRPKMTNALWENLLLPKMSRDDDVLFGPSYTVPLTYGGRSVVSIHSVNEAHENTHSPWHRYYSQKYRMSARKADRVIANSYVVKRDLQDCYAIPPEKIDVIWLGVDDAFRPLEDDALVRETRQRLLGSDAPYVLFVGKLSQRRNVPVLMSAFSELKKRDRIPHSLLLVGPNNEDLPLAKMAGELGIAGDLVHTTGKFVNHQELVAIYNAADAFVLPSSSDGFSLTVVEAMACGTPVITVNRAALGEIAKDYALTIDCPQVETLAGAMRRVLGDRALHCDLRAKGLERARSFRWADTARRTLEVLRQVAAN